MSQMNYSALYLPGNTESVWFPQQSLEQRGKFKSCQTLKAGCSAFLCKL